VIVSRLRSSTFSEDSQAERSPRRLRFFRKSLAGIENMQILTAEGWRIINDTLILCLDRPRAVGEHLIVTAYLLSGERVTGVVDEPERYQDIEPPRAA
jgi:hypothetical protein